jgi:UDP-N-acetylmuramoyl-L-alanyl-D-glutamate--2,6-diaminopimelate ligase
VRLDTLLDDSGLLAAGFDAVVRGDPSVDVIDITIDSRQVVPRAMFACVPGERADGHAFAGQAVSAGATALLVERQLDLRVTQLVVPEVRAVLGLLADALWGHPSRSLVVAGITGTSGKTTTAALIGSIFDAHGWPATVLGTLSGARTTAEAPDLQRTLAEVRRAGNPAVAMEVSSHALTQGRVEGTHFAVVVFTNLTQDHLDFHHSMEAYFQAKALLFVPGRADLVVVNADDRWGQRLLDRLAGDSRPIHTFRMSDASDLTVRAEGSRWTWRGTPMQLRLGGRFNVMNALAAATAAAAVGIDNETIARGLGSVPRVRGRFERVDAGQAFSVLVDYSHKPDALRQALVAARELSAGRLIVVFGAGGDRDRAKRPVMGELAGQLADVVVLTTDNPRGEEPMEIIDEIRSGIVAGADVVVEPDRARAIAEALCLAGPDDIVLIAGKGHETYQEIGGRTIPFDDAEVAAAVLQRLLEENQ